MIANGWSQLPDGMILGKLCFLMGRHTGSTQIILTIFTESSRDLRDSILLTDGTILDGILFQLSFIFSFFILG